MAERFTAAEKASMVAEYLVMPHSQKARWRAEHGVKTYSLTRWKKAYSFGDPERSLVPRDTDGMSVSDGARVRLLELELEAERSAREQDTARLQDEIERLQGVNDALGKAIGLLHDRDGRPEPTDES